MSLAGGVAGLPLNSPNTIKRPPAFNVPMAPVVLTAALVVVQVVIAVLPSAWASWIVPALAFMPLRYDFANGLAAALPGGYVSAATSFLTSFFLQSDPGTLMINGAALLVLGAAVSWRLGTWRFLLFTALCTIGGSIACLLFYWDSEAAMVGAGGGLAGLFAAAIHFLFKGGSPMNAFRVAGGAAFRKPAWTLRDALADQNVRIWLAVFAFITAWNAVSPFILSTTQGVASWPANIGGFATGLMLFRFFDRQPRLRRVV
jgi:membrane associated rhomboid family serine protease